MDEETELNINVSPYPNELADLVEHLEYRPGWRFELKHEDRGQGSVGLTLIIYTRGYNSYHFDQGQHYGVQHYMPVPPAAFDRRSWQNWLFEQLLLVERHECMEFFRLEYEDGEEKSVERPYAPSHGPGNSPYLVREVGSDLDRRTAYTGKVNV